MPFVDLLPEQIRLIRQKNLGSLNLTQIEDQGRDFFSSSARSIGKPLQEIAERCRLVQDTLKDLLLIRLEREARYLGLPLEEIFKFWASSISGDLLSPIADRTSVFVALLDFAPSNFQAFAMVPSKISD